MIASFEIQNLKCGGCANTINTRLAELKGIDRVMVNNDENTVSFDYASDTSKSEAIKLLSKLGYPVVGEKNPLSKKAKSYVSCAIGRMNS